MGVNFKKSKKKDCFLQDRFIYKLTREVDEDFILFLKKFGDVVVWRDFDIPMICCDVSGKFRLECLMGSREIDIFFKTKKFEKVFNSRLEKFLS